MRPYSAGIGQRRGQQVTAADGELCVATSPARMSASSSDMSPEVTTTMSGDSGGRPEPNRRQVDATLSVVWFGASRETRYSTRCLAGLFPRRQQITSYVAAGVTGEPHQEIRRRRQLADLGVVEKNLVFDGIDVDDPQGLPAPIDESLELTQHGSKSLPLN